MKIIYFFVISTLFYINDDASKDAYIDKWADLAVVESNRTGIPVSVILAQAIVESNYGNSQLAQEAKNHFGIKCKSYWKGQSFYKKDDDRNDKGRLIESCFRAYDLEMDSFIDHSHFLMGSSCYSGLLSHGSKDYKSWSHGLQECGYATDKRYAAKLIKAIERHSLWQYDI